MLSPLSCTQACILLSWHTRDRASATRMDLPYLHLTRTSNRIHLRNSSCSRLKALFMFFLNIRSIVEWSVWTITYRPRRLFSNFSKPYVTAEHSCLIFEYLDSAWVSYRDAMAKLCSFSWELLLRFPQKVQLVWKASHHRAIYHNVISDTHCTGDVCIPRQVCIGR